MFTGRRAHPRLNIICTAEAAPDRDAGRDAWLGIPAALSLAEPGHSGLDHLDLFLEHLCQCLRNVSATASQSCILQKPVPLISHFFQGEPVPQLHVATNNALHCSAHGTLLLSCAYPSIQ